MYVVNEDTYLTHYGVPGMKWGVRKDQYRTYKYKATTDKTNILKRKIANVTMVQYMAKGRTIQEKQKFDDKWYKTLSTGKEYIEAGTKLNRISSRVDNNVLAGRMYVSSLASDSEMYKATIPAFQNGFAVGKKEYNSVYQVELQTKKRLSMPSEKERIDTFIEVLKTKDGKQWLSNNGYKDQIDELNAKQVGLNYYLKFNKYAGNQSVKLNDTYFNTLKKRGYNALTDDNDAGIWSKKPTILLSPRGTVKVTSVRQLSAKEINAAQRKVMDYRNYPGSRR